MIKKYKNIIDILLSFYEEYLITNNITYTTVGNTLVAAIDSIRNLNIKLKYSHTVGHYDAIVFEVKYSEIESPSILFRDVSKVLLPIHWKLYSKYVRRHTRDTISAVQSGLEHVKPGRWYFIWRPTSNCYKLYKCFQ